MQAYRVLLAIPYRRVSYSLQSHASSLNCDHCYHYLIISYSSCSQEVKDKRTSQRPCPGTCPGTCPGRVQYRLRCMLHNRAYQRRTHITQCSSDIFDGINRRSAYSERESISKSTMTSYAPRSSRYSCTFYAPARKRSCNHTDYLHQQYNTAFRLPPSAFSYLPRFPHFLCVTTNRMAAEDA